MALAQAGNHLELLVLAAIRSSPGHGYVIMQEIERKSHGQIDLAPGAIYPVLRSLEEQGLVASRWESVGGRRRRTYSITSVGRAALGERAAQWRSYVTAIEGVLGTST